MFFYFFFLNFPFIFWGAGGGGLEGPTRASPFLVHFRARQVGEQLPRAERCAGYVAPFLEKNYMHLPQISYHINIFFFQDRRGGAPTYICPKCLNPPFFGGLFGDYLGTIWGLFGDFLGVSVPGPPYKTLTKLAVVRQHNQRWSSPPLEPPVTMASRFPEGALLGGTGTHPYDALGVLWGDAFGTVWEAFGAVWDGFGAVLK